MDINIQRHIPPGLSSDSLNVGRFITICKPAEKPCSWCIEGKTESIVHHLHIPLPRVHLFLSSSESEEEITKGMRFRGAEPVTHKESCNMLTLLKGLGSLGTIRKVVSS